MEQPREYFTLWLDTFSFRRLAWLEWGDRDAPVVLCVHGLTRNAHDFATLAAALSDRFRVIAVDLPGRGRSDWLDDPARYQPPVYAAALAHLLAAIGQPVAWVGTSLGGICGMLSAAAANAPVSALVLNDIGPFIPQSALARIRDYMAAAPAAFEDLPALEAYLRRVLAPFGPMTDDDWRHFARHSGRDLHQGRIALHYDPAIATPIIEAEPKEVDLWPVWSRIGVPRLVIRGAESDLLEEATLARMEREGAESWTLPEVGHAPSLTDQPTIQRIRSFLEANVEAT